MKLVLSVVLWLAICSAARGQNDSLSVLPENFRNIEIEAGGVIASGYRIPFWLQANQFALVPRSSPAGTLRLGIQEQFCLSKVYPNRHISYGLQVAGNAARTSAILFPEAYVSLDLGHFSLWGGRKKEIIGLGDSTLTSGFYSWSGNALPVTKIQIGTNGFTPLGFTNGFVSLHAFFAHGWIANSDSVKGSFLHQKALYVRLGRPNSRVHLTAGVLHNAQWGGRSDVLAPGMTNDGRLPDTFNDFLYVLTAREGNESDSPSLTKFDRINRVGNHLGSIDFSVDIDFGRWQAMGYYQHPFEDKSGVAFINLPDGLYGIRLMNTDARKGGFQLQHILFEYFNTMSQSGSIANNSRYDGQDDYFNNYQYVDGWQQGRYVIGTPFLSRRDDVRAERRNEQPEKRIWAITNNRVQMGHLGLAGSFSQGVQWQAKLSISQNYGTYRYPFVQPRPQFSGVLSLTWPLRLFGGAELRTAIALDHGQLYDNVVGGWISLRKVWKTIK